MRTHFNNQELAHVWASQEQAEGHGSNFYFEGPTIYSYGGHFPIATFAQHGKAWPGKGLKDVVLFTTRRYSVSTTRHIGYARAALRGRDDLTIFYVPEPTGNARQNLDAMAEEFERMAAAAVRSRSQERADFNLAEARAQEYQIAQYAKWAKVKAPKLPKIDAAFTAAVKARVKAENAALRRLERERAEYEKQAAAAAAVKVERWKQGEDVHVPYAYNGPTLLRVKDGRVETSLGAAITLKTAWLLWDRLNRTEEVKGMKLDLYTVNGWDGQTLAVGCHRISREEMARLAAVLGWGDVPPSVVPA